MEKVLVLRLIRKKQLQVEINTRAQCTSYYHVHVCVHWLPKVCSKTCQRHKSNSRHADHMTTQALIFVLIGKRIAVITSPG